MKIVNLTTFLEQPEGTLFTKYAPIVFEGLCIKEASISTDDFFYQRIVDATDADDKGDYVADLMQSEIDQSSIPMDFNSESRDGCFNPGQLFAIWEKQDVIALIFRLSGAFREAFAQPGCGGID